MPEASIILPTLNERENLEELLPRLLRLPIDAEIILVDDASQDGTAEFGEALGRDHPVRVIRRPKKLGLSTAVVRGFEEARAEYLFAMDADLSHDPAILPEMLAALKSGADIAIGSRYIKSGGVVGWTLKRQIMSLAATFVAKALLGVREKDPMSGYFGIRKSAFARVRPKLRPKGYKILLEILVRGRPASRTGRPLKTKEVGFIFHDREHGKSKISGAIAAEYAKMVFELFFRRR
jgi:dolichol-phosphate mannosyltransferase